MTIDKKIKTPLVSIIKRDGLPAYKAVLIRVAAFVFAFLLSMVLSVIVVDENMFDIIGTLIQGATIRPWRLLMDASLLLAFGIAIVAPFKMKYWNMGANGQVLVGALVSIVLMFYLDDFAVKSSFNNVLLIVLMLVCSIIASVIWGVIPAIFKVYFNTNETLFTLMMNYIAAGLVSYINYVLAGGTKESPGVINPDTKSGWLPVVMDKYFIPIIITIHFLIYFFILTNLIKIHLHLIFCIYRW